MSTPIENNTEGLQELLRVANSLPEAGGGGGLFIVTANTPSEHPSVDEELVNISHTVDEIADAFNAGENIVLDVNEGAFRLFCTSADASYGAYFSVFTGWAMWPNIGVEAWLFPGGFGLFAFVQNLTEDDKQGLVNEVKATNLGYVKTINGEAPDENGNVNVEAGGGGGGKLVVTADADTANGLLVNLSHTYAQIKTAFDAGAEIVLRLSCLLDVATEEYSTNGQYLYNCALNCFAEEFNTVGGEEFHSVYADFYFNGGTTFGRWIASIVDDGQEKIGILIPDY